MAAENAPASGTRFADLRVRLASACGLGVVALGCLWLGGLWTGVLAAVAGGLMMAEWRVITASHVDDEPVRSGALYIFAVGWAPLAHYVRGVEIALFGLFAMTIYGLVLDWRRGQRGQGFWACLGALYIGLAALALVELRAVEPYGFLSILWAALVVIAADVGGYFAGKTFGGPKLWPAISPKKTWSGILGGVVLAFLVGGVFSWATTGTYFPQVCAVSVAAAVLSQAGDLGESALKRRFGVKDAGAILPGHGGVLDRLDGHIAALLVVAGVTLWRGEAVFIW